jgi:4-hydroxy-tetrahydrodipicolinate reductase
VKIKLNEITNKSVIVVGGNGNMGAMVSDYVDGLEGFQVVGIIDPNNSGSKYSSLSFDDDINCDYIFEFSPSSVVNENIPKLINNNSKIIIGSSGVDSDSLSLLRNTEKGIALIPNFSIGAAIQKIYSQKLTSIFPNVHIIEKHHKAKEDAPSGTSKDLANSLDNIQSSQISGDYFAVSNENSLNIYSLRSDEYLAEQEVVFSDNYEEFIFEHKVFDRKAYLSGVQLVLQEMEKQDSFIHGLEELLNKSLDF